MNFGKSSSRSCSLKFIFLVSRNSCSVKIYLSSFKKQLLSTLLTYLPFQDFLLFPFDLPHIISLAPLPLFLPTCKRDEKLVLPFSSTLQLASQPTNQKIKLKTVIKTKHQAKKLIGNHPPSLCFFQSQSCF